MIAIELHEVYDIIESSFELLLAVDSNEKIIYASRRLLSECNTQEDGIIGLQLHEIVTSESHEQFKSVMEAVKKGQRDSVLFKVKDCSSIALKARYAESHGGIYIFYGSISFLQDLLYLLMINSLELPPLRERSGDIPLVARYFLNKECEKAGKKITDFSDDVMNLLKAHSFPNNLRELRHIVTTMVINEDESIIGIPSLTPYIRDLLTRKGKIKPAVFKPRKLSDVEHEHVLKMLEYYNDDKEKTARKLGIQVDEMNAIPGD